MTRKERKQLEALLAAIAQDKALKTLDPGMIILPGGHPLEVSFLLRYHPREIKWIPKTGEIVYVAQDGTEHIRHIGTQLTLRTAGGATILKCRPYPQNLPCMDDLPSGHA